MWSSILTQMIFQFHKGSIKTGCHRGVHGLLQNFNSIKVRLRPALDSLHPSLLHHYFNSIKVRLRRIRAVSVGFLPLFQFHKGSIKTFLKMRIVRKIQTFQFHKGSIKTMCLCYSYSCNNVFQFHKGSIKT